MTQKEIIDRVVNIALEQVGTAETPKGSNVNKYAKFFDDLRKQGIDIYNGAKQGASWCDIFADYIYIQATSIEVGPKMIYQPLNGCGAGCKFSAGYYRNNKAFYAAPEVGDQIFFGEKGKETHTGIVVKVTDKMVYTVEGNTDDQVKAKSYQKSNKNIAGYGRPNWSVAVKALSADKPAAKPKEKPKENPKPTTPSKPVTPSKPTVATKTYVVVCPKGLNIRKSYSDSSPKIGALNYGAKIQVSKEEKGWVKLANRDGWCCIGSKGVKYLKLKK